MQTEFTDEEDVYHFYKTYAMVHNFAVRLDQVRRDSDGCVVMRQVVCNQEGSRRERVQRGERVRDHHPMTRSKCPAKIRASLDVKNSKWKVVSFYEGHFHDLVDPLNIKMMPEYRNFSAADKAHVKNLYNTGIRTCHIMEYLATQKGGFLNLTFNKKDLYNLITQHIKEKV
ncbi:hypothetical protein PIB30_117201 [Stylosanthes scabra]|uniref:FAR1 domain-containing protein n=1 Tax=Stylosanthes scabra TaxID=79078 RepID=A0ABU6TTR8_9FABA|nr:hypothetical protein [Stylosanthes scabra]